MNGNAASDHTASKATSAYASLPSLSADSSAQASEALGLAGANHPQQSQTKNRLPASDPLHGRQQLPLFW